MSAPYTPQPGTIPAKVVAYLQSKPKGFTATTAEICEAIGQDSTINLPAFVQAAEKNGALKRHREPGIRFVFWSLGDGTPVVQTADEDNEPDRLPVVQRVLPASAPATQQRTATNPFAMAMPSDHFSVSADLNNTLQIRAQGADITLNSEQLQLIVRMASAIGITP